jgi:F0F1-type ATP synthase membrane subunit c/vacuolar-type H+-ATPase subunit K
MKAAQTFRALLIVQFVLPLVSRLLGATHPASHPLASHFAHPHIFLAVGLTVGIANFAVLVGLWRFQSWARIGNIIVLLIVVGFAFYALGVGFVGRGSFGMMYVAPFVQGVLFAMMFLPPLSLEFERQKV